MAQDASGGWEKTAPCSLSAPPCSLEPGPGYSVLRTRRRGYRGVQGRVGAIDAIIAGWILTVELMHANANAVQQCISGRHELTLSGLFGSRNASLVRSTHMLSPGMEGNDATWEMIYTNLCCDPL